MNFDCDPRAATVMNTIRNFVECRLCCGTDTVCEEPAIDATIGKVRECALTSIAADSE